MEKQLQITITAFEEITIDPKTDQPTGTRSGWRIRALIDHQYLLIETECRSERDVRTAIHRLVEDHVPRIENTIMPGLSAVR